MRSLAHALGFRFRLHRADLPGRPDFVLPRYRTAVFVHGCFWHRHEGCKKATSPKSRIDFWQAKFRANVDRDAKNEAELVEMGWRVLTIWECETHHSEALRKTFESIRTTGGGTGSDERD